MQTSEFDTFCGLLDQLCATWDRPPAKDELAKAYWNALKDVKLSEIKANVERIIRTATGKSPFPKPAELRNEAPHEQNGAGQAAFEAAEKRCARNLDALKAEDPERWRKEVALRRLDRILATEHEGSPIYAQALKEWREIRHS